MTNDEIIERLRVMQSGITYLINALHPAEEVLAEEPKAAPAKPVTLEDVRAALTDLTSAKGAATTKQLLAEYGVKKLSEIATDKYATLLADAKAWAGE